MREKGRRLAYAQRRYITQVEGQRRTEAIIKLNAPTYVAYVEVYPASRQIPNFAMMTTLDDPPRFDVAFERVADKQHKDIEGLSPVRFRIEREVLYLRMSADQGKSGVAGFSERLSWLQDTPIVEITSSQLACETHPEIVAATWKQLGLLTSKVRKQYRIVDSDPDIGGS